MKFNKTDETGLFTQHLPMAGKGEMIEVEMDTTDTGCCGGVGWEKVSMRINPDGSFTVHEHAEQEKGRGPVSKTASSVKYDTNKDVLAVVLDGEAREVRIPGKV